MTLIGLKDFDAKEQLSKNVELAASCLEMLKFMCYAVCLGIFIALGFAFDIGKEEEMIGAWLVVSLLAASLNLLVFNTVYSLAWIFVASHAPEKKG